jgi:hypothetical protein
MQICPSVLVEYGVAQLISYVNVVKTEPCHYLILS